MKDNRTPAKRAYDAIASQFDYFWHIGVMTCAELDEINEHLDTLKAFIEKHQ